MTSSKFLAGIFGVVEHLSDLLNSLSEVDLLLFDFFEAGTF